MKPQFNNITVKSVFLTFLTMMSCTKENTHSSTHSSHDHSTMVHELQYIPAGIYRGESTHLKSGIAFSWMEFSGVDELESVNISLPMAELLDPAVFLDGPNTNMIEIDMPAANRCKEIFNKILVSRNALDSKTTIGASSKLSFNFYLNPAPFNSSMDCHAHHVINKMPEGFTPDLSLKGCINGLGLIWNSRIETEEPRQAELVLGSANGDLAFYSPTLSFAAMINQPDYFGDIPLPIEMTPGRYYPTKFYIKQSGTELVVSLKKFIQRN